MLPNNLTGLVLAEITQKLTYNEKNGSAIGGYLMNHNCKKYGTVVTG